ncbi:MAG: DUF4291 domain-containing protein [Chloroflexi bacterium]|nr:DUF4291 domain-containing protein [Chloroflexota bacterium]
MPREERVIRAAYDDQAVMVYQAFTRGIVDAALAKGTFDQGFRLDRMTWIKPSFGWMLYRSGYATKPNQEAILRIQLSHEGFTTILSQSVESDYRQGVYETHTAWKAALRQSDVRHQWDPDRTLRGDRLPLRRAIQIGIQGWAVRQYVGEWIVGLEDVTALAHAIHDAVRRKASILPDVPEERIYSVAPEIMHRLRITGGGAIPQ